MLKSEYQWLKVLSLLFPPGAREMEAVTSLRVYRRDGIGWGKAVQAKYYELFVNGERLTEFLTVPSRLRELAIGYLLARAYVEDPEGIERVWVEEDAIRVETAPDFEFRLKHIKGEPLERVELMPITSSLVMSSEKLFEKVGNLTDGLPSVLLSDTNGYLLTVEDVRAEEAFYKAIGKAVVDHFDLRESFLLFNDYLLPDYVIMAAYLGIPVIGTTRLPTDLAVSVAEHLGITLFALTLDGLILYTHPARIQ